MLIKWSLDVNCSKLHCCDNNNDDDNDDDDNDDDVANSDCDHNAHNHPCTKATYL